MTVHFVGAGPGAPDLITVRGLAIIRRCPVVLYAGSLVPREVVAEAPAHLVALLRRIAELRHHGDGDPDLRRITPDLVAPAFDDPAFGFDLVGGGPDVPLVGVAGDGDDGASDSAGPLTLAIEVGDGGTDDVAPAAAPAVS